MPIHIENQEARVFKTVYEEGGFKKAADKLHVTQSAVSQTLSNLERKLDTRLLERTSPPQLTDTGLRFLHYAELVLNEESAALADINNIRKGILSTLILCMNSTVARLYADDLMQTFCVSHPLTRLKVEVMPSRQIIATVASGQRELGFGPFQQKMPVFFDLRPLFRDHRKLVVSRAHAGYPALCADPLRGIRQVPLIVSHLDDPDLRPTLEKLRDTFGTIWEVNDLNLRVKLVSEGMGISYMDGRILASHPLCADFTELGNLPFSSIPLTFGLIARKDKNLSEGTRQFMDICERYPWN